MYKYKYCLTTDHWRPASPWTQWQINGARVAGGGVGQRVVRPRHRVGHVDQAGRGVQQVIHFICGVGPGVDHDGVDGGSIEELSVADQFAHTQWHFTFLALINETYI